MESKKYNKLTDEKLEEFLLELTNTVEDKELLEDMTVKDLGNGLYQIGKGLITGRKGLEEFDKAMRTKTREYGIMNTESCISAYDAFTVEMLEDFADESQKSEQNRVISFSVDFLTEFLKWVNKNYTNDDEDEWTNGVDNKSSKELVIEFLKERYER